MEQHKARLTRDPSSYGSLSEYPAKPDADPYERMVQFLCTVGKLKTIDRTGWILEDRAIPKPEPVAGHMYRMGIISMLLDDDDDEEDELVKKEPSKPKLDINKVIKMSLIHDMAECIVGDITPFDGITEEEKHRRELDAMKHLVSLLPNASSKSLFRLYEEYEARQTAESKVVKELDRFDVALQAFQYERSEWNREKRVIQFEEFFTAATANISTPKLRLMIQRIVDERNRFWKEVISKETVQNGTTTLANGLGETEEVGLSQKKA